jgi:hypothetical protein
MRSKYQRPNVQMKPIGCWSYIKCSSLQLIIIIVLKQQDKARERTKSRVLKSRIIARVKLVLKKKIWFSKTAWVKWRPHSLVKTMNARTYDLRPWYDLRMCLLIFFGAIIQSILYNQTYLALVDHSPVPTSLASPHPVTAVGLYMGGSGDGTLPAASCPICRLAVASSWAVMVAYCQTIIQDQLRYDIDQHIFRINSRRCTAVLSTSQRHIKLSWL